MISGVTQMGGVEEAEGLGNAHPDGAERSALKDGSGPERHMPWERPCAAAGLKSYRIRGAFGWILMGAKDGDEALKEARRSTEKPDTGTLEAWVDGAYRKVASGS